MSQDSEDDDYARAYARALKEKAAELEALSDKHGSIAARRSAKRPPCADLRRS